MKKRNFTLLEILIALTITLIILTFLLGAYFSIQKNSIFWRKEEQALFGRRLLQHRLQQVFGSIPAIDQKNAFFFTTETLSGYFLDGTPSIIFTYNNEKIFDDPALSGLVLARLYVDTEGQLTLITWTDKEDWTEDQMPPFHREVLMKQVANVYFQFFQVPPDSGNAGQEAPSPQWQDGKWLKEWTYSPGIIKMIITKSDNSIEAYNFLIADVISVIRE